MLQYGFLIGPPFVGRSASAHLVGGKSFGRSTRSIIMRGLNKTVSASREKKSRVDVAPQGPSEREQKKQLEAKEAHRTNVQYTVVGVICVVLAAFLILWQSGVIQRGAAAVTVDGVKYNAADVQYYYTSTLAQYGMRPGSLNGDMRDSMVQAAADALISDAAIAAQAKAEGYTLSAQAQEYLDSQIASLDTVWKDNGYPNQKAFLKDAYGPYMTYDKLVALVNLQILANDYSSTHLDSLEYDAQALETYYQENKANLDSYTFSQFTLTAKVETEDELTDEEKTAALEAAKTEQKAIADEILSKLEAGEAPAKLAETYADQLSDDAALSQTTMGSAISSVPYAEWIKDDARKSGDTALTEQASGSDTYYYYVTRFEGRTRDDAPTDTVRHILVAAETDEGSTTPTDAQYEAAKAKAEELLKQWESGDATEDSFAELAKEHSADAGSATEGGLITDIHSGSGYVADFSDWATDEDRQVGDTGIVKNTGSSVKGWHIMYYVGANGDPVWEQNALSTLRSKDYTAWRDAAVTDSDTSTGLGLKFVQG